jgi:hypothetical protein
VAVIARPDDDVDVAIPIDVSGSAQTNAEIA